MTFARRDISGTAVSVLLLTLLTCGACVESRDSNSSNLHAATPAFSPEVHQPDITAQGNAGEQADSDRIDRFRRLAAAQGSAAPEVEQVYAPPGSVPGVSDPLPVVRVVFDERAFFDFDQPTPRPEARSVIDLIAETMRHDIPGAAVTVLGHTDAVGSDAYNIGLSQRRAASVMAMLVDRGLDPRQLSTVAIGSAQPIAPNSTSEGRARNRRVEFMISGSEQANLAVIADRAVDGAFLRTAGAAAVPLTAVQILKPSGQTPSDGIEPLVPAGVLALRPASPDSGTDFVAAELPPQLRTAAARPAIRRVAPAPPPALRPAEPLPALRPPSDPTSY